MNLLIALIPALGFGSEIISMQLIGGKFTNKTMGMGLTTLLAGLIVYCVRQPVLTPSIILGATICGVGEAIGLVFQVLSLDLVGVTMTMPISIGEQLIGTNLIGAICFHEWLTTKQWIFGISAVAIIIAGICLTSYHEKKSAGSNVKKGMIYLLISSLGFIAYGSAPTAFNLQSWDVLFPEAVGIFVTYVIVASTQKDNQMWEKPTWKNMITGLCDVIGNFSLIFSVAINGEAVGYTLSQMSVIISTLGGFFILHEIRTKKETKLTIAGLGLVVVGAILIGMTLK